jgi:hypothetical protein
MHRRGESNERMVVGLESCAVHCHSATYLALFPSPAIRSGVCVTFTYSTDPLLHTSLLASPEPVFTCPLSNLPRGNTLVILLTSSHPLLLIQLLPPTTAEHATHLLSSTIHPLIHPVQLAVPLRHHPVADYITLTTRFPTPHTHSSLQQRHHAPHVKHL